MSSITIILALILFVIDVFVIVIFAYSLLSDIFKRTKKEEVTKCRKKKVFIPDIKEEQIKQLARECKTVSDRLNTLLAISNINCAGKSIKDQLEEIADLISLRFRDKHIGISCTVHVSFPRFLSFKEQSIYVSSKNYSKKSRVVISEDLLLNNGRVVGKIQLHTLRESDKKYLRGESSFLRSVSRVVSKVLVKMVSQQRFRNRLSTFQEVLDSSAIIILILDKNYRVVFHNKLLEDLTGWSYKDFKIRNFFDIIDIETEQSVKEIKDQEVTSFISTLRHKDGSLTRVVWDVSKISKDKLLLVGRDITKEFNLRSKSIRTQQDLFLEKVIYAIANDLNNIFVKIKSKVECLLKVKKRITKKEVKELLNSIRICTQTSERLLSLVNITTTDEVLKLYEFLPQIVSKIELPNDIQVKLECEEGTTAKINESQIVSILDALVRNSIEAKATIIVVQVIKEVIPLTEVDGNIYSGIFVKLSVYDNGVGIPSKHLKLVFEPYFSTKRNLGLGLTLVRKIANNYEGFVSIHSNSETVVSVYLPYQTIESLDINPTNLTNLKALIIDDETPVADVIKALLTTKGISCFICTSIPKAMQTYKNHKFDLVLIDLTISDLNEEVLKTFKNINPRCKIVICSGYPDATIMINEDYIDSFLKKPFDSKELFRMIDRIIKDGKKETV